MCECVCVYVWIVIVIVVSWFRFVIYIQKHNTQRNSVRFVSLVFWQSYDQTRYVTYVLRFLYVFVLMPK